MNAQGCLRILRDVKDVAFATVDEKGFEISEACIGCGKCRKICPQQCISTGKPFEINQNHCLHCGLWFENCPVKAITKRSV